jgi:hypothetical protein
MSRAVSHRYEKKQSVNLRHSACSMEGQHVDEMVDRLGERTGHSMPTAAIA